MITRERARDIETEARENMQKLPVTVRVDVGVAINVHMQSLILAELVEIRMLLETIVDRGK